VLREQKWIDLDAKYRYGYQGNYSEHDEETSWNHFELREYDPIIGRWTSVDPEGQYYSPYVAMGNSPIIIVDPDGGKDGPGGPFAWFKNLFGIGPKYVPAKESEKDFGKFDLENTVFELEDVVVTAERERVMEPQSKFWSFISGNRSYTENGRNVAVDDSGFGKGYEEVGGTVDVGVGRTAKTTMVIFKQGKKLVAKAGNKVPKLWKQLNPTKPKLTPSVGKASTYGEVIETASGVPTKVGPKSNWQKIKEVIAILGQSF
jgi:RHS repeat-associated protein